jgi:hypothetical protein
MVFHALSDAAKKQKASRANEFRLNAAIDDFIQHRDDPSLSTKSRQDTASEHHVDYSTLCRRVNGGRSLADFNLGKQNLTPAEEKVLVNFILESADWGFPMTHQNVVKYANDVLKSRGERSVGDSWVGRFLRQHNEVLQTHWSKPLDTQRARAVNPDNITHWFDLAKEQVVDLNI